eukprot:m.234348 g.234348  ORF g.234348 m.234348 type:complete len:79 (-) comp54302_c0_seq2:363-599(-)
MTASLLSSSLASMRSLPDLFSAFHDFFVCFFGVDLEDFRRGFPISLHFIIIIVLFKNSNSNLNVFLFPLLFSWTAGFG